MLDLEYKSVSSGEGLGALLETHPTLTVRHRLGEGGEGRGQGVSVMLPCFFFDLVGTAAASTSVLV